MFIFDLVFISLSVNKKDYGQPRGYSGLPSVA